jgi:hypothetical protein
MPDLFACVDGLTHDDSEADYDGAGQLPPFRIFIPNAQAYLAGDYQSRESAQREADKINRGDYATTAETPDSYLAKFTPDQRETAARAYADGFADGANDSES